MVSMSAPAGVDSGLTDGATSRRLETTVHKGRDAVLQAIASAGSDTAATAFQSLPWLSALFAELLPAASAHPVLVEIRTGTGALVLMLPLVSTHERGLNVLRVPSFGVSDYGGPILGPACGTAGCLWTELKTALAGHDLIVVENMPRAIAGRANPLIALPGTFSSQHHRNALTIEGTVDEFLRALGKKFRKEVERCGRLLADRGSPAFKRAETSEEIAAAFAVLKTSRPCVATRPAATISWSARSTHAFTKRS